jgi:hypothetical protein
MVEFQDGFNNARSEIKGVHGRNCMCECDIVVVLLQEFAKLVALPSKA